MSHDNPPAFPVAEQRAFDGTGITEGSTGMTLRDWFAGQAPPPPHGFTIESPECENWSDAELSNRAWSEWNLRRAVAWSTSYADAMLAARGDA